MAFCVVEVVVTSQPNEVHTSTLITGPTPHASTLTTDPATLPSASTAEWASTVRFSDLIDVPTRDRGKKRTVVRPPSYRLTSLEHFNFVLAKADKKKLNISKVRKPAGVRPHCSPANSTRK